MGSKIFISYRRVDTAATYGRIYDRLAATFGKEAVFKDVDAIPFGVDFRTAIRGALDQCAVQLVVIGGAIGQSLGRKAAGGPGSMGGRRPNGGVVVSEPVRAGTRRASAPR